MSSRSDLLELARRNPDVIVDDLLRLQTLHTDAQTRILTLEKELDILRQDVVNLKARLAQNSANSHKPPSTDGYAKPAPKSLRGTSGRRSGGQPGHPGRTLEPVKDPDKIVPHLLTQCPNCRGALSDQPALDPLRAQVFELPPQKLVVTEHRAERKLCPHCRTVVSASLPVGVSAPACYGPDFKAWLIYLRCQQFLPTDRIRQTADHLFHAPVSEAVINDAVAEAAQKLLPFETAVAEQLLQSPVAHADESGLRVAGKLHWLHSFSSPSLTWYGVHPQRGSVAINAFNLLPRFSGRLVHDCLATYFDLPCDHALCNEHLRRELTFVHEQLHQLWALRLFELLTDLYILVQGQKQTASPLSEDSLLGWSLRYDKIIAQGRSENPPLPTPPVTRRGRVKQSKPQNLLDRLEKHKAFVFAFARDFNVPFSNNQAEQDIRMIKVLQKISGGFRTLQGARTFIRLRSYLSTVRKNNQDVFAALVKALAGTPFLPATASP